MASMSDQTPVTLPLSNLARAICSRLLTNTPENFVFADTGAQIMVSFDARAAVRLHALATGPHYHAYGYTYVLVYEKHAHVVWVYHTETRRAVGYVERMSDKYTPREPLLSSFQIHDPELTADSAAFY